jgi:hypothetical protein
VVEQMLNENNIRAERARSIVRELQGT